MADYKTYLATNILTEDKTVTYRLLSRALKVHVNTAKGMLYDFHRSQNAKKPKSLHATYLVAGIKPTICSPPSSPIQANGGVAQKDGEDAYMQSSPFMPSSMPQVEEEENAGAVSVTTITLVREEDLQDIKLQYTHISSIHVYSLAPSRIPDLQLLSDVTRQLRLLTSRDDPLSSNSTYGTITNPLVRRRTGRRPPPPPAAITAPKSAAAKAVPSKAEPPKLTRQDSSKTSQPSSAKDFFAKGKDKPKAGAHAVPPGSLGSAPSSKEGTPAPPANLKREGSSIFKAFAKTKEPTKKKAKTEEIEDVAMSDDGDDDGEDVHVAPVQSKTNEEESGESRNRRKVRQEQLMKMMEDSDEDEISQASKVDTPVADEDDVDMKDEPQDDDEPKEDVKHPAEETEPSLTVSNGRRRGRRRVMKKTTVTDEEGYLVTKEEAAWESFSEDEPVSKAKPKSQPVLNAGVNTKAKKPAAKAGQGNIMSFFGKK